MKSVFAYISKCCGVPAIKTPLIVPKVDASKKINHLPPPNECGGLGKWRCPKCKDYCSVIIKKAE